MTDLQNRYLTLLKNTLLGSYRADKSEYSCDGKIIPPEQIAKGDFYLHTADTMIGLTRLNNIQDLVVDIIENNIPGDLIETGVWHGGACIFMRALLNLFNIKDRSVWVADSFCGFPPDCKEDIDKTSHVHGLKGLAISADIVKGNFKYYNLLDDQVKFLEGYFRDTLPTISEDQKFSVIRLDGDLYESTKDALVNLYPKLSKGGYCIIDDYYSIYNCKMAVDEYRHDNNIKDEIKRVDWTCIYWQKS